MSSTWRIPATFAPTGSAGTALIEPIPQPHTPHSHRLSCLVLGPAPLPKGGQVANFESIVAASFEYRNRAQHVARIGSKATRTDVRPPGCVRGQRSVRRGNNHRRFPSFGPEEFMVRPSRGPSTSVACSLASSGNTQKWKSTHLGHRPPSGVGRSHPATCARSPGRILLFCHCQSRNGSSAIRLRISLSR
jgi:hypothetical protein